MTDPIPLAVHGGALHSAEAFRVLNYMAADGVEGVVGKTDMAVKAGAVPGGFVEVMPGVVKIRSRAPSALYEMYIGRVRTAVHVPISATGSSGGRTDGIIFRIEEPATGFTPPHATEGPFAFVRVLPNLAQYGVDPATVTSFDQLGLGQTAYLLGKVVLPANTGTVTQAMINPTRGLSQERKDFFEQTIVPSASDVLNSADTAWSHWPNTVTWTIPVPSWATEGRVSLRGHGMFGIDGPLTADIRTRLNPGGGTEEWISPAHRFNIPATLPVQLPFNLPPFSAPFTVGTQFRGKTYQMRHEASWISGNGSLTLNANSSLTLRIDWKERVE